MNLTVFFAKMFSPVLKPIFNVRYTCIYVIVIGFLCGFPMGANVISQLYKRKELSYKEAEFLLAFCNNIGPVYILSFALPIIGVKYTTVCLIGMYVVPLLYGLLLRYTLYAKKISKKEMYYPPMENSLSFVDALDDSVIAALDGITNLGGYMIFFNLLNVLPHLLLPSNIALFGGCLLEITGGLQMLKDMLPIYSLIMLSFGGLSCLLQTYNMIKGTGLSVYKYLLHKSVITIICAIFYGFLVL